MRQITRLQLAALWFCVLYFVVAFSQIGGRAAWGFLRLASEHREPQVPRELLLAVADSAARDFRWHALLVAIGCVMLGLVVVWITKGRRT